MVRQSKSGVASLALAVFLSGCGTLPEPAPSAPELPSEFVNETAVPGPDEVGNTQADATEAWYEAYEDERLNGLVQKAQQYNLDITVAVANLDVARAQLEAQETVLLPVLDGFLSTRLDLVSGSGDTVGAGGSAGVSGSFDPDISGGNRARTEAVARQLEQAAFDLADVERLIVQSVVLAYIDLRRAEARLALLDETLALQEQTLQIVTARFEVGLSAALDVDRAAADLASSRSQRGLFEASQKQASYSLDVLVGETSGTIQLSGQSAGEVPTYSGEPELGLPANLLRNRPDVRAGEQALLRELSLITAERADLLPRLTLPGTLAATGGDGPDVISASLAPILDIPFLDFGRRQAEVEAQRARARAAQARYVSLVLNAHREVETALTNVASFRSRLDELREAGDRSQSAYNQLEALYREGLASFIDILDAQRTLIQIREQIVETEADLASALALLSSSLGLRVDG